MPKSLRLPPALALLAMLAAVGVPLEAQQQRGTVTGRVVDAGTLQPIASAQVFVPNLNIGTVSREDGRFVLSNVPAGSQTVSAQIIGFRNSSSEVNVVAGQTATVDFQMQQDALSLDEIIVTGTPGGTQRRAIGNVVTRVDAEQLTEKQPVEDMQQMLGGRAPGLSFMRNSGNVGTGSQIRIRGVSSLSLGTQPLIYVDGVRINNSGRRGPSLPSAGASASSLDDINPDDIASIEVIKGPAAATLYGTEASAGVIQIITKKGQSGEPSFDFATTQGSSFLKDPAGMLGEQWGCRVAARPCPTEQLFSFNLYDIEKAAGRNPFSSGHNQGYNLSVRGGSEAIRYFLSSEWSDQVGLVDYNWDKTLNLRANVGVFITEGLNLDVSSGYISGNTRYLSGDLNGGLWDNMLWAQGNLLEDPKLRGYLQNTPEDFETIETTRAYNRFTGSATLTHNAFSWLTQRLIAGTDYASDENQILYPRDPAGAAGPFRNLSLGSVNVTRPLSTLFTLDYSASAKYGLRGLGMTSSVGAQYYSNEENSINGNGTVFASPAIRSIEGATNRTVRQDFVQNKSLGFFGQQELNYNDRVYLTAALRADDNSAFGSEFDAAIYPKVSAAWVVSEEPFFDRFSSYVNSFRLRSAWGKAGRQPNSFAAVTLFTPSVGPGGSAVVTPGQYGNPNVGPEVSTELELGFEAALFGDRFTTDFTYFSQQVKDALIDLPLIPTGGFSGNQQTNVGQLNNKGWEVRADARLVAAENFSLSLGASAAHSINEIIDLGGRPETNTIREGFPYPILASNIIRSAEFDSRGEVVNLMCDGGTGRQNRERGGESVPCAKMNGLALMLGTTYPTHVYAMDGTIGILGNLELFTLIQGEFGRWGSDTNVYCRHNPCYSNSRASLERKDPVFEEGVVKLGRHPDDTTLYVTYDADFVKLREVGARYRVPNSWAQRIGANGASISLLGRNLAMLWQRQKYISGVRIPDPELTSPTGGGALFQVPGLASVTASVRVSF